MKLPRSKQLCTYTCSFVIYQCSCTCFLYWILTDHCSWLQVHMQPCHIVYTDYRPTPLQHYVYPAGGDGLYMVVDEKAVFRDSSFQKAVNALSSNKPGGDASKNGKMQKGGKGGASAEPSDMFKIVKMIMQRQFDPVIVFSFSKRNCEENAGQVRNLLSQRVLC